MQVSCILIALSFIHQRLSFQRGPFLSDLEPKERLRNTVRLFSPADSITRSLQEQLMLNGFSGHKPQEYFLHVQNAKSELGSQEIYGWIISPYILSSCRVLLAPNRAIINYLAHKLLAYFRNAHKHKHENLKTTWKLMKFIWKCSIYIPLVTLKIWRRSAHVLRNCHPSTFATPYEIGSLRDCGIVSWYTWSFTYPHR
jgi:hypothetical protein